jgi:uncharacterized membrane protein
MGARSSGVHAKWRFAVSSLVGVSAGLVAGAASPWQFAVLVGWNVGAAVTLAWIWRDVAGCDATSTRRIATLEDPSRTAIDIVLTAASVVSLGGMVAGLRAADHLGGNWAIALDTASVCTVATSWVLVHSLFALRYARLYYREPVGGIDFHGQGDPDYHDFGYLALTIGMSFAVSDTDIGRREIRRTVLRHALVSYVFGAGVVGLAINLIASLVR